MIYANFLSIKNAILFFCDSAHFFDIKQQKKWFHNINPKTLPKHWENLQEHLHAIDLEDTLGGFWGVPLIAGKQVAIITTSRCLLYKTNAQTRMVRAQGGSFCMFHDQ